MAGEITIPDAFGALELKDQDDRPVLLGSLWESRPALLFFVRHFG